MLQEDSRSGRTWNAESSPTRISTRIKKPSDDKYLLWLKARQRLPWRAVDCFYGTSSFKYALNASGSMLPFGPKLECNQLINNGNGPVSITCYEALLVLFAGEAASISGPKDAVAAMRLGNFVCDEAFGFYEEDAGTLGRCNRMRSDLMVVYSGRGAASRSGHASLPSALYSSGAMRTVVVKLSVWSVRHAKQCSRVSYQARLSARTVGDAALAVLRLLSCSADGAMQAKSYLQAIIPSDLCLKSLSSLVPNFKHCEAPHLSSGSGLIMHVRS